MCLDGDVFGAKYFIFWKLYYHVCTHRVLRELRDHLVSLAPQDPPAQLDPLADLDQLVLMENLVTMEILARTDLTEHL